MSMFLTFRFTLLPAAKGSRSNLTCLKIDRLCFGFAYTSCVAARLAGSSNISRRRKGPRNLHKRHQRQSQHYTMSLRVQAACSLVLESFFLFVFPGQTREQQCPIKASLQKMHDLCGSSEPVPCLFLLEIIYIKC